MSGYLRVDVDGTLTAYPAEPTSDLIREAVGDWWDMVPVAGPMMGWVDDSGHVKGLPRNVVGSLLLMALGAAHHPYAGPVVITGWHPAVEIRELGEGAEVAVRNLHEGIRAALAGGTDDHGFADAVRDAAEEVRTAATPSISVVVPGGEGQ